MSGTPSSTWTSKLLPSLSCSSHTPPGETRYLRADRRRIRSRRGVSAILIAIALVILIAFVALAVDFGRVWLARAEMQTVADAAARAGALSLPVGNEAVYDYATDAALRNPVIDAHQESGRRTNPGVELEPDADIVFGIWDGDADPPDQFRELEDNPGTRRDERRAANAVLAWGRRIEDRDNPLPLIFAPLVGVLHTDIERRAIARIFGGSGRFSFIGIDWVHGNGNHLTVHEGSVASDGDIDLGNSDIHGDARPGIGHDLILGPNADVTGWTANLDYTLKPLYPPVELSDVPGNAVVLTGLKKNQPLTLTGGATKPAAIPHLINGKLDHPDPLTVNGYVILFVNGDIDVQGNQLINTAPPVAEKLEIRVIGRRRVDLGGNAQQYVHLYAPESDVKVHGTPGFHGTIVAKTLDFRGVSQLYGDLHPDANKGYQIRLVK